MREEEKEGALIVFPKDAHRPCPSCGNAMRPATHAEVTRDLQNPHHRHMALQAAQGRLDWKPPPELGPREWAVDVYVPGTWLLRCDTCGDRTLVEYGPPDRADD